jgi:lysophospholipase L1-like esterase
MKRKSGFLAIGSVLLVAVACAGGDDGGVGNAGAAGMAGMYYDGVAGGWAGAGGALPGGTGGSELAGTGGVGGSIEAGTGGLEAGTGGVAAGTGGTDAGTGGTDAGTGGGYMPPCLQSPSQVVVIGDSYMTMYPDTLVSPRVAALAEADGALGAGETYRDYSVPGTSMATGEIPSQFTQAVQADPDIELMIMTGGGNDVLIGARQCLEPGSASDPACQQVIQDGIVTAQGLYDDAVAAGVSDVVYFFYPHIPASALLTGGAPNEILDYAYPLVQAECEGAEAKYNGAIRCYFIDLRPVFGDTFQYINVVDGIHPTAPGADLIAEEIYRVMKDNCLGQPESKGCCAP